MKDPMEWDEADIQFLIQNRVQESLELEYKGSDALGQADSKKAELSKDVSAFANSAGGVILYGMAEDGNFPTNQDEGIDPSSLSKEWLEQVINSSVQQRIEGLRIRQIAISHSSRVRYAVIVPQASSRAPHQAKDKKYYKRFNFQSVAMEDYEIRDLRRRSTTPDLKLEFQFRSGKSEQLVFDSHKKESSIFPIKIFASNLSPEPAHYARFDVYVDSRFKSAWHADGYQDLGTVTTIQGIALRRTLRRWGPPADHPIFAEASVPLTNLFSSYSLQGADFSASQFWLGYDIRAPGCIRSKLVRVASDGSGLLAITDDEIPLEIVG